LPNRWTLNSYCPFCGFGYITKTGEMLKNGKVNILIVDDVAGNIFALEQLLTKPERVFIAATNGRDALMTVLNKDIDLIILDVQMPGMDGFEVAKMLKTSKRTQDVPIIFVSAEKKEHQFVLKGYEEGGIDYLYKPLDPEITEAKVAVLLQLHLQKRELKEKNTVLEKYDLLINNSADLICIINAGTLKFEEVNNAVIEILKYSVKEIKDTSLLFHLPEEDRLKVQKISRENVEKFSIETRIYNKNREIKWLNWNIINRTGWWFANARDITGIKKVEEIKNYLASVVRQSNEAIYLHDPDGKIISWNDGAEKIYGFTEEEALKMKIWNIVPEYLLAETQEAINNILAGVEIQLLETKRITKHGKIIDVLFSASVLVDVNKNLKSIAITERDITEQKHAAEKIKQLNIDLQKNIRQLKENEEQVQTILKNAPDAVVVINEEGKIVSWNPKAESIFGWTADEVMGKYLHEIIIPLTFRSAHQKGLNHFLQTGEGPVLNKQVELPALRKDNTEFDAGISISPTTVKGKYYFIGFISDITYRKKAEAEVKQKNEQLENAVLQLNQVNKELESFSYSVSHDLRAPLRALNGFSQILKEEFAHSLNEEGKRLLNKIQYNAQSMGMLIDDLLAFSKLGKRDLQKSLVNMEELIKEVLCEIESSDTHRATIKINKLPLAYADHSLIRQVFTNLISNAVKYSSKSESPKIIIGVLDETAECVYYVKDNGVGFNMEHANKLFGVFQRLHSNEEFEGTGVGLAIVQRIILKHGGRVWAEAQQGVGATFYISLPAPPTTNH
jgi:PAS domain S-box-containing protein